MKIVFLLISLLLATGFANAQRYVTRNGHVWFYSHTPLEDIEAHNNQVAGILDVASGSMQFSLLVKSFDFKVALLQEHFNENYMESDKLPKADFSGKITNLSAIDFTKNGSYPASVNGDITIHGVTKNITTSGTFVVSQGKITATSKFTVKPQDFDIAIPDVVKDKIAPEVEVNVDIAFTPN
jgi:hypothetical protein